MSSTWGECIKLSIFGGSHTEAIGVNLDGLPAGEAVDLEQVLAQMARRAPGQDPTATRRKESDAPRVLCGLYHGVTTGAPLCAIIENTNQRSKDYEGLRINPRPGHADYTAYVKYGNHHDVRGRRPLFRPADSAPGVCRGGGPADPPAPGDSGGLSCGFHRGGGGHPLLAGGGRSPADGPAFREYFPVIDPQAKEQMREVVEAARMDCDSVGGTVECVVTGLPVGAGNPMFDGAENLIASLCFRHPCYERHRVRRRRSRLPAAGAARITTPSTTMKAGQVRTRSNHAGGILGGITNGMPLVFRTAFKPTASISKEQDTVNLETGENAKLVIHGRHDPCIVPRAAAAVEAAACVAVLELLAQSGLL